MKKLGLLSSLESSFPVQESETNTAISCAGMVGVDAAIPSSVAAVVGADAVVLARWADGQRVDLTRLAASLREVQAEADAAERDSVSLDHTLATAKAQLDAEVDMVRSQAAAVAASAVEEATKALLAIGAISEPIRVPASPIAKEPPAAGSDDGLGCEVGLGDLAEVYTWFWRDTAEQPVVNKLRKLVRRGAQ